MAVDLWLDVIRLAWQMKDEPIAVCRAVRIPAFSIVEGGNTREECWRCAMAIGGLWCFSSSLGLIQRKTASQVARILLEMHVISTPHSI